MSLPFQRHSSESQTAAAATAPIVTGKRAAVLRFIVNRGSDGATDDEIQLGLGMNPSTERPRRVELYEARLIVKMKDQRRFTRSGKPAAVWLAKAAVDKIYPAIPRAQYFMYPEDR